MRSLDQALAAGDTAGLPLPVRFPLLDHVGIRPRRAQVTMIVGEPGSGKSLFALDYALHAGIPTLYFSADSDDFTVATRAVAMLTGRTVEDVERQAVSSGAALLADELVELNRNLRFCFDPSPSLDDIGLEVDASVEAWGLPPALIVVDNLVNVVAASDNEWTGLRDVMRALHHLARKTGAAVWVLHHASEGEGVSTDPPARRRIQGKVSQLPELILTVAIDSYSGEYRVACVKNRSGPADPSGRTVQTLWVDLSRMWLTDNRVVAAARRASGGWE